jgi:hypothetical protein
MAEGNNPVSLSELIKIDDLTQVKELLTTLKGLNNIFDEFITAAQKNADKYTSSIHSILKATDSLEKSLLSLDSTRKDEQQTIAKEAAEVEKSVKATEHYKTALKATQDQILILTAQQEKLVSAHKKLQAANVSEAGSFNALNAELKATIKQYYAMGDATDQAVKDSAIAKIKELSKSISAVDKAVKEAKRGIDVAAGSYNELSNRVSDAKKRLKELGGGMNANNKEAQALKKTIKEGTDQLKKFDTELGVNSRRVGDYAGELGALHPALGRVAGGFGQVTSAATKLLANPIVAILAAIAAAIVVITKSVQTYFNESIEGQDKLNELSSTFVATQEVVKDKMQELGRTIIESLSNPAEAAGKVFDALWDNLLTRAKGFITFFPSVGKAIKDAITGDGQKAVDELTDAFGRITLGIDNASQKAKDFAKEIEQRQKIALELARIENSLRKERIKDIVDDAITELKVAEDLEKAKDKLRFSDEQRYRALQEANKLLREQAQGDVELAQLAIDAQRESIKVKGFAIRQDQTALDLFKDEAALRQVSYEDLQKLAELEAQQLKVKEAAATRRKALLKQEIAFVKEEEKERADALKREEQANSELLNAIFQGRIEAAKETVTNVKSTLSEVLDALQDIQDDESELAALARDKELNAAREAALERVELTVAQNEAVNSNTALSLEQRIALERTFREQNLEEVKQFDSTYMDQIDKTGVEYETKIKQINDRTNAAVRDNAFKFLQKDFQKLSDTIATGANDDLIALDQSYQEGTTGLQRTLVLRDQLQEDSRITQLKAQLDYFDKQKNLLASYGMDVTNIDSQIAQVRQRLSQETTDKLIADQQRLNQATEDIAVELTDTAQAFLEARVARNLEALDMQLADEQMKKDASLAIVQDDAQAKALIEQNFAIKQKEIQREMAKEKRKMAVFEKARSVAEIALNTAKGISSAVAESPITFGLPWSAFVAVTGALQLAQALSVPIPQYAKGTNYSPEGLAITGEAGRELRINPDGSTQVVDKPTLSYLERGTKIIPNSTTEQILKDAEKFGDGYAIDHLSNSHNRNTLALQQTKNSIDIHMLVSAMQHNGKVITEAIKSQPKDVFDERGHRRYTQGVNLRIERMDKRYKMGS